MSAIIGNPPHPPVDTYGNSDEVIKIVDDNECISYAFGGEYEQTAAYRMRKYKPGKDLGHADDNLEDSDADEQYNG